MTRSAAPRSTSRLFEPPSLDDLEYLPDPLGRLGMGSYTEKPEAADPQGWEEARADWRDGASMADLFGDRSFDLQANVGAGQPNRRADVFRLQSLLHREGYLDAGATDGPTGYWGGRDDDALRRFQKDSGLTVDGWAGPDGETIDTLRGFYRPQRPSASRPIFRTMEKRDDAPPGGWIEPIGLGRDDGPLMPTLLSDAGAGGSADAGESGATPEEAPPRPVGPQYAQAAPVADDVPPPADVPASDAPAPGPQSWKIGETGMQRIRAIVEQNDALPKQERATKGKYIHPDAVKTDSVDAQQCVALVQAVLPGINQTRTWRPGAPITGPGDPPLQPGTAVATFKDGAYHNESGYHAAIFLGYGKDKWGRDGIVVYDQWEGRPAQQRVIVFNPKAASASNNAGAFSVIQRPAR